MVPDTVDPSFLVLNTVGTSQRKWGSVSSLWTPKTQEATHSSCDCPMVGLTLGKREVHKHSGYQGTPEKWK